MFKWLAVLIALMQATSPVHPVSGEVYDQVLDTLFSREKIFESGSPREISIRRSPSFGFPVELHIIILDDGVHAYAYRFSDTSSGDGEGFNEKLAYVSGKFGTDDPVELAKHFKVTVSRIDPGPAEAFVSQLPNVTFKAPLDRLAAADGVQYSVNVSTIGTTLRYEWNSAKPRTPEQQRLHSLVQDLWRAVFPDIDFENPIS